MEVHAHTHTARKKWTHYLWEFIMLFLAVFCGFLAENKREHMVEHIKAKAYARSLLKDLNNDTIAIRTAERSEDLTVLMIDSLLDLTESPAGYKGGEIYYFTRFANWHYTIDWNKASLNQLISSGNLRFFTNNELVSLISEYNTTTNTIRDLETLVENSRTRAISFRDQILNASLSQKFIGLNHEDLVNGRRSPLIDSLRKQDLPLQSNDPAIMNSYLNALLGTKTNRKTLKNKFCPLAIKKAAQIIVLLKKEYDLE
jgi:hypothetical protein